MLLVDTHTHLFLDEFEQDIDQVIAAAQAKNVGRLLLPNIDSTTTEAMLQLAKQYPETCFPMMGLHPCSVKENYEEELAQVEQHLKKGGFCAVGEIGIDLHWDKSTLPLQQKALRQQIEWAKELNLPIVLHCRESFNEIYEIVAELNDERLSGVFHCFTGTLEEAEKIIALNNFKMGIGGVLTFKNSKLDEVVKDIDLEHLVLETDSPYLTPAPHRGKRNESAYVSIIADKLAAVKNTNVEEVAAQTSKNAAALFGIPV